MQKAWSFHYLDTSISTDVSALNGVSANMQNKDICSLRDSTWYMLELCRVTSAASSWTKEDKRSFPPIIFQFNSSDPPGLAPTISRTCSIHGKQNVCNAIQTTRQIHEKYTSAWIWGNQESFRWIISVVIASYLQGGIKWLLFLGLITCNRNY